MSGGSMDYAFLKVLDVAERMMPSTPARQAFILHLHLVAEALRSIEWVDSGDMAPGDEDDDIRKCLPLFQPDVERT